MTAEPASAHSYPVRVEARLDEPLSRWLWLVKWLLLIPHYIVLAFLWLAFVVTTVVAFFAVLFTGRYPSGIFHFNVGVLRWSWRVGYYGYSALGTDRYPPFTLEERPDYPATLDVAYPERLSRGLVLVKSWLLALPHYLMLAVLAGGASWTVLEAGGTDIVYRSAPGLLGLAVCFVAVALLFVGRYPRGLFDLLTGVNRWAYRVIAYAALMTDAYPPFRLDQGGSEPAAGPDPAPGGGSGGAAAGVPVATGTAGYAGTPPPAPARGTGGGSAGAVVALVVGLLAFLPALGLTAGGGALLWLDGRRDAQGFVSTEAGTLTSATAAVTVEDIDLTLEPDAVQWIEESGFGQVRVRATAENGSPLFLGIAREEAVDRWLAGTAHDQVTRIDDDGVSYRRALGPVTSVTPPGELRIWSASASGTGPQQLDWTVENGRWALVVARADGGTGVYASATAATTIPDLTGWGVGLLASGLVLLVVGAGLVVAGATAMGNRSGPGGTPATPYTGAPGPVAPSPVTPQSPVGSQAGSWEPR